jgi:hypothetical protein
MAVNYCGEAVFRGFKVWDKFRTVKYNAVRECNCEVGSFYCDFPANGKLNEKN